MYLPMRNESLRLSYLCPLSGGGRAMWWMNLVALPENPHWSSPEGQPPGSFHLAVDHCPRVLGWWPWYFHLGCVQKHVGSNQDLHEVRSRNSEFLHSIIEDRHCKDTWLKKYFFLKKWYLLCKEIRVLKSISEIRVQVINIHDKKYKIIVEKRQGVAKMRNRKRKKYKHITGTCITMTTYIKRILCFNLWLLSQDILNWIDYSNIYLYFLEKK